MDRKALLFPVLITVLLLSACGETSATFDNIRKNRLIAIGSAPFEAPLLYQMGQDWVGADAQLGEVFTENSGKARRESGSLGDQEGEFELYLFTVNLLVARAIAVVDGPTCLIE